MWKIKRLGTGMTAILVVMAMAMTAYQSLLAQAPPGDCTLTYVSYVCSVCALRPSKAPPYYYYRGTKYEHYDCNGIHQDAIRDAPCKSCYPKYGNVVGCGPMRCAE